MRAWISAYFAAVFASFGLNAQSLSTTPGGLPATPTHTSASGVVWNPALIGVVHGNQIESNISLLGGWLIYDRKGQDPNTGQGYASSDTNSIAPNLFLSAVSPLGTEDFRFGYATYFPGGAIADFSDQGSQRYQIINGMLLPWHHQFTLAYSPNPNWSFAASGIFSVSFFESDLDVDLAKLAKNVFKTKSIPSEHPALSSRAHIPLSMAPSYGWALGAFYWPNFQWSFGASFYSPVTYKFESDLDLQTPKAVSSLSSSLRALGINSTIRGHVQTRTTLPAFAQAGFRYQPYGYWSGEYFTRYIFNSWQRSLSMNISSSNVSALNNTPIPGKYYDDSWVVGTVQSFNFFKRWGLGFHANFYKNGVSDSLLSPTRIDFDSLTAGPFVNYNWSRHWQLSGEYSHSFLFERSSSNTESQAIQSDIIESSSSDGNYRAAIDRVGIGLRYAF